MGAYKFKRSGVTTVEEVNQMLPKLPEKVGVIMVLLYLLGFRISEALKLKREDFELENGNLKVTIQLSKKRDHSSSPYALGHILRVKLDSPFVKDIILPFLDKQNSGELLFPYKRQSIEYFFHKASPKISPHIFRKDRLTKLTREGASEFELQDFAGWADARPANHYVTMDGRLAAKFADKIK